MAIFVLPYSRVNHAAGLVLTLFCLLAVSCDFSQGFGEGKGSLTIVLPGVPAGNSVPVRNKGMAARAVHLPEAITGLMTYSPEFYPPGGGSPFTVSTGERVVAVELDPGRWVIAATAWYGAGMAALDKAEVNIQAGRENSVSFTMNADDFITPDISGAWVNQDKNLTISDPSATLAITLAGAAAFPLSADGPTALPVRGITKMRVEPEPILTLPRFLSSVPEQRPLALR